MRQLLSRLAAIKLTRRGFALLLGAHFVTGVALTAFLPRPERSVFDLGFDFGPAIEHVSTTGVLADATRMPVIPYLLAAFAHVSVSVTFAVVAKNLLTGALLAHVLWATLVGHEPSRGAAAVAAFALTFPLLTRLMFLVVPEEAYLCALVAFLFHGLARIRRKPPLLSVVPYAIVVGIAYLTKSSLTLFCPVIAVLFAWRARRGAVLALFATILAGAALVWAFAVHRATGEVHFTSSLDGYNFWKGNNPSTLRFYPERSLDFISGLAPEQATGESEWAWSRRCFEEGFRFDVQHPVEAARLIGLRVYRVFFAVLEEEPVDETAAHRWWRWASVPHMVVFRIVWLASISFALRDVVRWARTKAPVEAVARSLAGRSFCYLAFVFAFVTPFLAAWAATRHVLPLVLPTLAFALQRFLGPQPGTEHAPVRGSAI